MDISLLNNVLKSVEKPTRYTGGELNMRVKSLELPGGGKRYRFALCFPDVYEIGMSHLGSRIVYNVLNEREDTYCERVFAPWFDMEKALRENGLPIYSLETKTPVSQFDIIGFSLLYEMCYTNILTVLDLAKIPFRSRDRHESDPLIIAGGPCVCNPEPVADIMDVLVFGDGEEVMNDLMDVYSASRKNGDTKEELLKKLAGVKGLYVPAFYESEYGEDGCFKSLKKTCEAAPDKIERRIVRDLDSAEYTGKLVVPYMSIVHDRVALEVFRGCTRGCRFCQAGFIYRPFRTKSAATLCRQGDGEG